MIECCVKDSREGRKNLNYAEQTKHLITRLLMKKSFKLHNNFIIATLDNMELPFKLIRAHLYIL